MASDSVHAFYGSVKCPVVKARRRVFHFVQAVKVRFSHCYTPQKYMPARTLQLNTSSCRRHTSWLNRQTCSPSTTITLKPSRIQLSVRRMVYTAAVLAPNDASSALSRRILRRGTPQCCAISSCWRCSVIFCLIPPTVVAHIQTLFFLLALFIHHMEQPQRFGQPAVARGCPNLSGRLPFFEFFRRASGSAKKPLSPTTDFHRSLHADALALSATEVEKKKEQKEEKASSRGLNPRSSADQGRRLRRCNHWGVQEWSKANDARNIPVQCKLRRPRHASGLR